MRSGQASRPVVRSIVDGKEKKTGLAGDGVKLPERVRKQRKCAPRYLGVSDEDEGDTLMKSDQDECPSFVEITEDRPIPFPGAMEYEAEASIPSFYNERSSQGSPQRVLDSFRFFSADGHLTPLHKLDQCVLWAYGHVLLPEKVEKKAIGAAAFLPISFQVDEWCIEFGQSLLIWVKSVSEVWYKLLAPDHSYQASFRSVQSIYELCASTLSLFKKKISDYATIVNHLKAKYNMDEKRILKWGSYAKQMIVSSFPQHSGAEFFSTLNKKITQRVSKKRKFTEIDKGNKETTQNTNRKRGRKGTEKDTLLEDSKSDRLKASQEQEKGGKTTAKRRQATRLQSTKKVETKASGREEKRQKFESADCLLYLDEEDEEEEEEEEEKAKHNQEKWKWKSKAKEKEPEAEDVCIVERVEEEKPRNGDGKDHPILVKDVRKSSGKEQRIREEEKEEKDVPHRWEMDNNKKAMNKQGPEKIAKGKGSVQVVEVEDEEEEEKRERKQGNYNKENSTVQRIERYLEEEWIKTNRETQKSSSMTNDMEENEVEYVGKQEQEEEEKERKADSETHTNGLGKGSNKERKYTETKLDAWVYKRPKVEQGKAETKKEEQEYEAAGKEEKAEEKEEEEEDLSFSSSENEEETGHDDDIHSQENLSDTPDPLLNNSQSLSDAPAAEEEGETWSFALDDPDDVILLL